MCNGFQSCLVAMLTSGRGYLIMTTMVFKPAVCNGAKSTQDMKYML